MRKSPKMKRNILRRKLKRSPVKRSPVKRITNSSCNHSNSFSCYHYEQTVIINGQKHHKSQNMCKCYDCGMEFKK